MQLINQYPASGTVLSFLLSSFLAAAAAPAANVRRYCSQKRVPSRRVSV